MFVLNMSSWFQTCSPLLLVSLTRVYPQDPSPNLIRDSPLRSMGREHGKANKEGEIVRSKGELLQTGRPPPLARDLDF